jgi:hypothetical protein
MRKYRSRVALNDELAKLSLPERGPRGSWANKVRMRRVCLVNAGLTAREAEARVPYAPGPRQ